MPGNDKSELTRSLEREFGVLLRRLRKVMADRAKLVHPELSVTGYGMLMQLSIQHQRSSDLADTCALDKGAVSRVVRQLEGLGMVERVPDPDDGRAQLLQLTATARTRLSEVADCRRNGFTDLIEGWDVEDLRQLVDGLRRYNEALV